MIPYFFMLSLPSALALAGRRRVNLAVLSVIFVILWAMVGLRYHVGMDWGNYEGIHASLFDSSLSDASAHTEALSYSLFWLSDRLTNGTLLSNIVAGLLLLGGVFSFARRTINPGLAIVAAMPYLVIAFGMSGIRQAMGVGITLFVLARWERRSVLWRSAGILVASLFHSSALVMALFIVADLRINRFLKFVGGAILFAFVLWLGQRSEMYVAGFEYYRSAYMGVGALNSPGAIFHLLLILAPALAYLTFRRQLAPFMCFHRLIKLGSLAGLADFALYFVSSTGASRLALYLYFIPMMVYPAFANAFGRRSRGAATTLIVLLHFGILAAWLLFGNNSYAHLPYRTVLTH